MRSAQSVSMASPRTVALRSSTAEQAVVLTAEPGHLGAWVELPDPPELAHLNRVRFADVYAGKAVGWLGTSRPRRGHRGGPR